MKKTLLLLAATLCLVLPAMADTISQASVQKLSKLYNQRATISALLEQIKKKKVSVHLEIDEYWSFDVYVIDDPEVLEKIRLHYEKKASELDAEIKKASDEVEKERQQKTEADHYPPQDESVQS